MKHEIGISDNCVCNLSDIKVAGFKNVMICERSTNLETSLQQAFDLGFNIPYVHIFSDNSLANYLWCTGAMNNKVVQNAINSIKLCNKYGISTVVMHVTCGDAINLALGPNKYGIESMQKILEVATANNICVAIENVDNLNTQHLYYLLDNIISPYLGYCYDCGHNELYNENINFMKKYGGRCFAIHIHDNLKDWQLGMDWTRDLHLLPFDGKIDFEKIMKNIANSSYNGVLMLELQKETIANPEKYRNFSVQAYLEEAYKRGEKLLEIFKKL